MINYNLLRDQNDRPVSLTSKVIKSLERLIHNHIISFPSDNKLLCDNQHGFRPLRSPCNSAAPACPRVA